MMNTTTPNKLKKFLYDKLKLKPQLPKGAISKKKVNNVYVLK